MTDGTGTGTGTGTPPTGTPPTGTGTGTGTTPPWYEGKASPEIIGHWENKHWDKTSATTIAIEATKQARELQTHFGVPADQLLKLPATPSASGDEAWLNVYQRLGMPKEAKDYDFSGIKFGDSELEQTFAESMRAALHKAHVSKDAGPEVVKAVVKYLSDAEAAEAAAVAANKKSEIDTLMRDWGNDYQYNQNMAMQGARRLGVGADEVAKLETVLGYAKVMEMFRKVGAGTTEATFVGSSNGPVTTVGGAKDRLDLLQKDQAWAAKLTKGDVKTVEEFHNLMSQITGESLASVR